VYHNDLILSFVDFIWKVYNSCMYLLHAVSNLYHTIPLISCINGLWKDIVMLLIYIYIFKEFAKKFQSFFLFLKKWANTLIFVIYIIR
jgi:hypothetical protein